MNQDQIKEEAKQILDKFASALEKVEEETKEDFYVHRDNFERVEGEGKEGDSDFKKNFLKNAPEHNEDFIIVERGEWE